MHSDWTHELGMALKKSFNIDADADDIGKLAYNLVIYFQREEERDAREAANKAQWDEDRIDIIGQNGNIGYE